MSKNSKLELLSLMESLFEETATEADIARLEEIVLGSEGARRLFVETMNLHGMLYWDAAGRGSYSGVFPSSAGWLNPVLPEAKSDLSLSGEYRIADLLEKLDGDLVTHLTNHRRRLMVLVGTLAAALLMAIGLILLRPVENGSLAITPAFPEMDQPDAPRQKSKDEASNIPDVHLPALASQESDRLAIPSGMSGDVTSEPTSRSGVSDPPARIRLTSDEAVIARINERLQGKWNAAGVEPSERATDAEWVRRIYLDLAGRIPTADEAESFIEQKQANKRQKLVDTLQNSPGYSLHLATVWTNLLVGRSRDQKISRETLSSWLEEQFAENHSWRDVVMELVAARGSSEESGPANFLLAHLNNQAVPATAITSRILLCEQLQCTQCHEHPTVKMWGQDRFWELNAFFQQAQVEQRLLVDQKSGRKEPVRALVDADRFGPTYYETLRGVMLVAFPKFAGVEITSVSTSQQPLREQLAELLFTEKQPQPARAFVNRTWARLMGYGFTTPVDDMGPHTPVSHPELLEDLTSAFVESGYDVQRLTRWICLSEAYQLSSQATEANQLDAPEQGEQPLFSRMYLKALTVEQLFDSLRIAGGATPGHVTSASSVLRREDWLRQFYSAVDTEENGEATTFDGSLPQALMMMNGDLVVDAIDLQQGQVVAEIASIKGLSEADRIRKLSLAALSRSPTSHEVVEIRDLLRKSIRQRTLENAVPPQVALVEGLRDVYWAYLNSSEFAVNH